MPPKIGEQTCENPIWKVCGVAYLETYIRKFANMFLIWVEVIIRHAFVNHSNALTNCSYILLFAFHSGFCRHFAM